jgi:hypothetical protein
VAITRDATHWLRMYVEQALRSGVAHRATAKEAVALTRQQHADLEASLRVFWARPYPCPRVLDLKPQHGYRSRVEKDGFHADEFVRWLVAGCSDVAEVATQSNGRPYLVLRSVQEAGKGDFDLIGPITSDQLGYVHVFDVIPKGLPARRSPNKKQPPRRSPRPLPEEC